MDDDIPEDRGFKALFTSYPAETVEVFCPDLWEQRGRPTAVTPLQQELSLPDLGIPDRFCDVALLAEWADGFQSILLLVEHWSDARKVDLDRVLLYFAALRLRHPGVLILPHILVTDATARDIPDRVAERHGDWIICSFHANVVRITPNQLPRLRRLQNRVAAILSILAIQDAVEAVAACMSQMVRAPGPDSDLPRFLPFAIRLARMPDDDQPRFRRRMTEDAAMRTIFDEIADEALAKGKAKGKAEGEAKGHFDSIRGMVHAGIITVDQAHTAVDKLVEQGVMNAAEGVIAHGRLG
jgi:hypothetical protein